MKPVLIICLLLSAAFTGYAQTEFIGMAKYKMTVMGGDEDHTDSMQVIFDKERIRISLFMPDQEKPGGSYVLTMIEDFAAGREYVLDEPTKTYKNDSMLMISTLRFTDTKRTGQVKNVTCTFFKADMATLDTSKMKNAECMVSVSHMKKNINNYSFMNMQPIIVDNRIVIDFLTTEPDGAQPRIYISELIEKSNVDEYFDLSGYSEIK